jgi:hypothetical protein
MCREKQFLGDWITSIHKVERNKESLKKAQQDKIENVAGSV